MFEREINTKGHYTAKEGEQTFEDWKRKMGIQGEDFSFKVKTVRKDKRGFQVWLNVASWGYYQGSDWSWYVFVSYRSSDGKYTCAYHWDVDGDGRLVGAPRKHEWVN